jgi:hypothetical protein
VDSQEFCDQAGVVAVRIPNKEVETAKKQRSLIALFMGMASSKLVRNERPFETRLCPPN